MKIAITALGLPFDGSTINKTGLGGSESCLFYMARSLARLGNEVTVYNVCEKPGEYEGVIYKDVKKLSEFQGDALLSYRWPGLLEHGQATVKVLVCHDMPVMAREMKEELWRMDSVFFLTQYQLSEYRPHIELLDRVAWVTANGVDGELAKQAREETDKEDLVVWGSRPERGLDYLLVEVWPRLLALRPELKLGIAGYSSWADPQVKALYERCERLLDAAPNVIKLGSLSKPDWYRTIAKAKLVLYPSRFPEVYCLMATEPAACGTPVVVTDNWAMRETGAWSVLVPGDLKEGSAYAERFVAACNRLLSVPTECKACVDRGLAFAAPLDWDVLAATWMVKLHTLVQERQSMSRPTVSVCMITRNEEHNITRCLASIQDIADEILICDASSTDKTVERAQEMGAQVERITDDPDGDGLFNFSWARNQSVAKAAGEWILWLDADEVLTNPQALQKYLYSKANDGYRIKQANLSVTKGIPGFETPIRLYRRRAEAHFTGVIHETPEFTQPVGSLPLLRDVELLHYGYVTGDGNFSKLMTRNLALLDKERKLGGNRPITAIYVIRDMLNLASREIMQRGYTEQALKMLWTVVDEYKSRYQSGNVPHAELALELSQMALKLIGASGKYPGRVKKVALGVKVRESNDPADQLEGTELYFTDPQALRKLVVARLDAELANVGWS